MRHSSDSAAGGLPQIPKMKKKSSRQASIRNSLRKSAQGELSISNQEIRILTPNTKKRAEKAR
jgi:hypothetical protein